MARKPSDDIRDAKRDLKIKNQQIEGINYNNKGESKGWSAEPTVKKTKEYRSNADGFRVDWDEKHHLQGLNLYDVYTDGMSPEQIKKVDARLAAHNMFKGNIGPNRIDLPRRFHVSSKYTEHDYEGAHQKTSKLGIDSKAELERLRSLSPEERLKELDKFVVNQVRHRRVGQSKFMEQFQLQPGNTVNDNPFGGNFTQQVIQERDPTATRKAGKALKAERAILKARNQPKVDIPKVNRKTLQALPLAPLVAGLVSSGKAFAEGKVAEGLAEATGAIVGEVPVVGDAFVSTVEGTAVADGTVTGWNRDQLLRPLHNGKHGPNAPRPGQREKAERLKANPSSERGYETIQRVVTDGWNGLKQLFMNK